MDLFHTDGQAIHHGGEDHILIILVQQAVHLLKDDLLRRNILGHHSRYPQEPGPQLILSVGRLLDQPPHTEQRLYNIKGGCLLQPQCLADLTDTKVLGI